MQSQYRTWCTHSQPKSCRVGLSRVANQESLHLGFQKHPCSFELGTFAKTCVLKVIGKHKARWCIRAKGTRSACYQVVHKKHVISRPNLLWHDMKISDCEQLLLHTVLAISGTLLDSCIASKAGDRSFRLRESEGLRKWFHWQCAQPIG
jgi:hypothetical protein